MRTLIIYDKTGKIFYYMAGDFVEEPDGLPFIWVDVPAGKTIDHLEMQEEGDPIVHFTDIPLSREQQLENRIAELEDALCDLSMIVDEFEVVEEEA